MLKCGISTSLQALEAHLEAERDKGVDLLEALQSVPLLAVQLLWERGGGGGCITSATPHSHH